MSEPTLQQLVAGLTGSSAITEAMLRRAMKGIADAIAATNGFADNDHDIKVRILEPCMNDLNAMNVARQSVLDGAGL